MRNIYRFSYADKHYIKPLGLNRNQVWITDLFKCRYPKEVYREKQKTTL